MKDNIIVGAMAGTVGGTVGVAYSHILFLLGVTPMSSIHIAATLVVIDIIDLTALGFINALFTHLLVAAVFGVLLTYLLMYTGKDFWALKGLGLGALFCLVGHSYLIPLMRTDEQVRALLFNELSWTTAISTHMLIGLIAAAVIIRYHCSFTEDRSKT